MQTIAKRELDHRFLDWLIENRLKVYNMLEKGEFLRFFDAHLPVLVTVDREGNINTANKGVGLLPKQKYLDYYIELFESTISRAKDWKSSFSSRLAAIREFYENRDRIDRTKLGTLEIFEGRTLRNIIENPRVVLHFTGSRPRYVSFQVNAMAEVVKDENSYFQFLVLARKLFEHDSFHLFQPGYSFGYVFHVDGCIDKTPFSKARGHTQ